MPTNIVEQLAQDGPLSGVESFTVPDSPASAWSPAFPSSTLVDAAGALFEVSRRGLRDGRWSSCEGAQWRISVGPGLVSVGSVDYAKRERAVERTRQARDKTVTLAAVDMAIGATLDAAGEELAALWAASPLIGDAPALELESYVDWLENRQTRLEQDPPAKGRGKVTSWSRKSRAAMVRRLLELDYTEFLQLGTPAMLTLTYPGDWLPVAGSAVVCRKHVEAFKESFRRAWGRPLVGIWKREFQRRGAPHYHIFMVPPTHTINGGETFRQWASRRWAEIVNHPDAEQRQRHLTAGTGVDYGEGMRAKDPRRLAVYFSKHGSFAAKEYQNEAPAEWLEGEEGVGRFWGVWGLETAVRRVEVSPADALAAARTMRRWQRANGFRAQRTVWRTNTKTGEQRPRRSGVWVGSRMRGHRGFIAVNDGPAFASALARYLDRLR